MEPLALGRQPHAILRLIRCKQNDPGDALDDTYISRSGECPKRISVRLKLPRGSKSPALAKNDALVLVCNAQRWERDQVQRSRRV